MQNYIYLCPNQTETYNSYIERLLISKPNVKQTDIYMEGHHILPRCLGGSNNSSNLIWLYPEEHYFAHKLLAQEQPQEKGLQFAWWQMAHCLNNGRAYEVSEEDYREAKTRIANILHETMPGRYTGIKRSAETKLRVSQSKLGEKNPNFGKKISEEAKQKCRETYKKKLAEGWHGSRWHKPKEEHPNYGKHYTTEQRQLMSERMCGRFTGGKNPRANKIRCIETAEIFDCAKAAGFKYAPMSSNPGSIIIKCCRGKIETAYGLHWEYIEKEKEE